jgi:uncharacterized membrane protein YkvA (DUF1232 family)
MAVKKNTSTKKTDKKKEKKQKDITAAQKRVLNNIYENTKRNLDDDDIYDVIRKTKRKLEKVPKRKNLKEFKRQIEFLHMVLRDGEKGSFEISKKAMRAIAAGLSYFISPIDIIPDAIPIIGYLDDVYVLLLCIEETKDILSKYCNERKISPGFYGLNL